MLRLILQFLILLILLGGVTVLVNYLIFFWIDKRRTWKQQDEEFQTLRRNEALKELVENETLFNEIRNNTIRREEINERTKVR